jgi:IclR family pca regulon transcriptional regulator
MSIHEDELDYRVPALQRGLSILQMFNANERNLSSNVIAERLGVSVSAIYRILITLTDMGYLRKLGKNSYELGPQVLCDGFAYLASRDLVDIAMPHLNALRDRTSLSCHLSIREHTDSLYIGRAFAAQRLSVNIPIGTRIPCHCTAMGRMLLSGLTPMELDALYQHVRLDDYPAARPQDPARAAATARARPRARLGDATVPITPLPSPAPCVTHRGNVVAAINLSGPEAVMDSPVARERYRESLQQCADAISVELGSAAQR